MRKPEKVLAWLRAMHAEESPENLIRQHLESERLLSDQGIYDEVAKELPGTPKIIHPALQGAFWHSGEQGEL